jgi:prephenate dehydrogenase
VSTASRNIDRYDALFDDPNLVGNAGLILVGTLIKRLGLEALINERVRLGGRVGGSRPGRKVLTMVCAIIAGATHIDHVDILRAGATNRVLGFRVMAPSTIGTFLRAFTFGHVRQLDAVADQVLQRVWNLGAGPVSGEALVVDVDSTIAEVHGHQKQGAAYGYTKQLGYHPLLATRAGTGEILHARMRKGSAGSSRGVVRFADELVARVRRAGADGQITLRADSGFWSWKLIDALNRHGVLWSITVSQHQAIRAAIAGIPEADWIDIDYTLGGRAQVAETNYTTGTAKKQRTVRLVVRRTRLTGHQAQLFPDWRHHAFITNTEHDTVAADTFHRNHAVVELAIRDLKEGAGLEHCPSGHYSANAAWLACTVLAHNLSRWTGLLGNTNADRTVSTHATMRTRLIAIAATLVNRSGRSTLRLPLNWPWAKLFTDTLNALRALPAPSG